MQRQMRLSRQGCCTGTALVEMSKSWGVPKSGTDACKVCNIVRFLFQLYYRCQDLYVIPIPDYDLSRCEPYKRPKIPSSGVSKLLNPTTTGH